MVLKYATVGEVRYITKLLKNNRNRKCNNGLRISEGVWAWVSNPRWGEAVVLCHDIVQEY